MPITGGSVWQVGSCFYPNIQEHAYDSLDLKKFECNTWKGKRVSL